MEVLRKRQAKVQLAALRKRRVSCGGGRGVLQLVAVMALVAQFR